MAGFEMLNGKLTVRPLVEKIVGKKVKTWFRGWGFSRMRRMCTSFVRHLQPECGVLNYALTNFILRIQRLSLSCKGKCKSGCVLNWSRIDSVVHVRTLIKKRSSKKVVLRIHCFHFHNSPQPHSSGALMILTTYDVLYKLSAKSVKRAVFVSQNSVTSQDSAQPIPISNLSCDSKTLFPIPWV